MDNRTIEGARGKVVGGCSSINAMAYYHGHPADYDRWAGLGLPEWSHANVLPYFRRAETWEGGADEFRGGDGPLTTHFTTFWEPLCEAFMAAGKAAGFPATDDYNGRNTDGFARIQTTMRNGRRGSTATCYLRPILGRPNLEVVTGALATRVIMEGNRAGGVEYVTGGESLSARSSRETILCGGAINSPHLLMLSGIGDPQELAAHGIAARVPLKGVGKNLSDHTSAAIVFRRKQQGEFIRNLRLDRVGASLVQTYLGGGGFASDLPFGITAFVKSRPEEPIPDMQLLFWMGPTQEAKPYLPPFKTAPPDSFSCRVMPMRPTSRGHLSLASADPTKPIRIHQGFLEHEDEWRVMRSGLRMIRDLVQQPALEPFAGTEIAPGTKCVSDADLDAHVRKTMITVHHPIGTAKMGPASDEMAVVDGHLKVNGVEGLRVVDASVMPDLIGGATNAPVIMIAEKAADMILGRKPLAPARTPTHAAQA